ncbi:MAG: hypothetical protein ACOC7U_01980, partial [Spirochaetota bacterium]
NNVEQLTYNLSAVDGTLNTTLDRVQNFFGYLSSEEGDLKKTLASLEQITTSVEEVTTSISRSQSSIGKLMHDNRELYTQIISLMEKMNMVMDDLKRLSRTLSDSSPEIKAAIERSNRTMDEAIGLMKTLKENVLIKGFSRKERPPQPVEDAVREGGY